MSSHSTVTEGGVIVRRHATALPVATATDELAAALDPDPVRARLPRDPAARDLVLYLPDALVVVDHRRERAQRLEYEFAVDWTTTEGLPREGAARPFVTRTEVERRRDHEPGAFAA